MDSGCHISHYPFRSIDSTFSDIGRVKGDNLHFNAVVKIHSRQTLSKGEFFCECYFLSRTNNAVVTIFLWILWTFYPIFYAAISSDNCLLSLLMWIVIARRLLTRLNLISTLPIITRLFPRFSDKSECSFEKSYKNSVVGSVIFRGCNENKRDLVQQMK